ncbi:ABC transporter permease [Roseovarius spongiae]|uniref:ABC transporter permease n=1 Tax=Roseovarius spongiae TaxID=2320272 RepID=A0A3A8ATQ3_9RHOB|nr:ABC transporter permease [Roseovarius spongiae]RKF14974.1 ABC transporter permease [Roseovarius spongiae]
MIRYTLRRLVFAAPVLLAISLVVFLLLDLAPGDPMAQLPLSIPPEVKAEMRRVLGLDAPLPVRFGKWAWQFYVIEPATWIDRALGTALTEDRPRMISWQTRAPVMDLIAQRLPQTLWVVGLAYVVGILLAVPLGLWSAYRQYSAFDQLGGAVSIIGFAVPPFFSGVLLILLFSVHLGWLPSSYDTTLRVTGWDSLLAQMRQMAMPVAVLSLQTTALISRYMRAAALDVLGQDHVRAARARGSNERRVLMRHVARNAMLPVVSVIALGLPQVFAGAIVTEQIFRVNGVGHLLITSIQAGDLPTVQTITVLLAVFIVLANLAADLIYAALDPRIRYA